MLFVKGTIQPDFQPSVITVIERDDPDIRPLSISGIQPDKFPAVFSRDIRHDNVNKLNDIILKINIISLFLFIRLHNWLFNNNSTIKP